MNSKNDFKLFDDAFYEMIKAMDSYMDNSISKIRDYFSGIDVHMYETDRDVVIEAYLQDYDRNQIQIEISGNQLRITAEKKTFQELRHEVRRTFEERKDIRKMERYITLPFVISEYHTRASYEGGVLRIVTPRMDQQIHYLDIEDESS